MSTSNEQATFWGNARDVGLTAVALLTFAGTIYTYTYVHVLGIDFSLADTSPVASLVAASKIFVENGFGISVVAVAFAGTIAAVRFFGRSSAKIVAVFADRNSQVALVLFGTFAVCFLGYVTALREVDAVRIGAATNPAIVTFEPGAIAKYPATLRDANDAHGLYVALESEDRIFVVMQPRPIAADPQELPEARVFSIRKSDVTSVETYVPSHRIP